MSRPRLRRVAPWVAGMVLAGAGVLAVSRRTVPLRMSPHCDTVAECEPACDAGSAWACEQLGGFLMGGQGVAKNPTRARELWTRACDGGDGEACSRWAWIHAESAPELGLTEDNASAFVQRALAAHQARCDEGWEASCFLLARRLREGSAQEQARAEALMAQLRPFWTRRCDGRDPLACLSMALAFDDDAWEWADPARAIRYFDRACDLGRAVSCSLVGYRHLTAEDEAAALVAFARGCELEDASSCGEAAKLTTDGAERARWLTRRRELHASQCDAQFVEACWSAAQELLSQESVLPRDEAAARVFKNKEIALRESGCDAGAADDCASLAFTFRSGGIVPRDIVRADGYAARACELGSTAACATQREVLGDVLDASVGYHTCVVKIDGTVWCWGQNREGQLGDGTTEDRAYPVRARGLPRAKAIDSYGATSCIVSVGGEAWCWGGGFKGAERVDGGQPITAVAAGYEQACALRSNGDVGCSGYDAKNFALGASAVRASGLMRCAIAAGKLLCWGSVMQNDLAEPTAMLERADVEDADVTGEGFCARFAGGEATCRARPLADSPTAEVKLEGVRLIGGDADAGCAMKGDELWCWYLRERERKAPFRVTSLPGVKKLIIRSYEGCALQEGGKLSCWYVFNPDPEPVTFERQGDE